MLDPEGSLHLTERGKTLLKAACMRSTGACDRCGNTSDNTRPSCMFSTTETGMKLISCADRFAPQWTCWWVRCRFSLAIVSCIVWQPLAHSSTHKRAFLHYLCMIKSVHWIRISTRHFLVIWCPEREWLCSWSESHHQLAHMALRHSAPSTNTVNIDSTLDIDDVPTTVSDSKNPWAHSRSRSMFGQFAERASPVGCEPNEQFEDLTSHNFASMQGDSGMNSISSSSGSMTEVAATTIPSTESYDLAPEMGRDNESMGSLQEKDGAQPKTKSSGISHDITRKSTTKLSISSEAFAKNSCTSNREMRREIFVLNHQYSQLRPPRSWSPSSERGNTTLMPKRAHSTKSRWRSLQFKMRRRWMLKDNSLCRKLMKNSAEKKRFTQQTVNYLEGSCSIKIWEHSSYASQNSAFEAMEYERRRLQKSRIISVAGNTETRFSASTKSGSFAEATWVSV